MGAPIRRVIRPVDASFGTADEFGNGLGEQIGAMAGPQHRPHRVDRVHHGVQVRVGEAA